MKTKYHFWLSYKVDGSDRERMNTTDAVSERSAKAHIQKCYGKEIKINYLEIQNQGKI